MACFSAWDIQACGCVASFSQLIRGCNSLSLIGYSIEVYDGPGGTHLATMTTDGTGHVLLATGNYWIESTDGRFAGPSFTVAGAGTRTLTAATGYQCDGSCALALAATLPYTDANGSFNLVANGTTWKGCNTVTMANVVVNCTPVTNGTGPIQYLVTFFNGIITVGWCNYNGVTLGNYSSDGLGHSPALCGPGSVPTICNGGACQPVMQFLSTHSTGAITCPPSAFAGSGTNATNNGTPNFVPSPGAGAWTLTE